MFSSYWLLKRLPFPYFVVLEAWWISFERVSMSLLRGSLFWSLGLCICFYVSIIQLWFLYVGNVFWNQEVRNFYPCFQDYFVYLKSLEVPYIFWICFFHFYENDNILLGIAKKLYLALGKSRNVNNTRSPVHEHDISFQLLVPCLILSVWFVIFRVQIISFLNALCPHPPWIFQRQWWEG